MGSLEKIQDMIITLRPIGIVESPIKRSFKMPPSKEEEFLKWKQKIKEEEKKIKNTISRLVILPKYQQMLEGIEEFSHIMVTYWPHLLPKKEVPQKIHPMGIKHLPLRGIFATCSPLRPNSLLISVVPVVEVVENVVKVKGLEALDGSPILDLKPYAPYYHHVNNFSLPSWMKYIEKEFS